MTMKLKKYIRRLESLKDIILNSNEKLDIHLFFPIFFK